MSEDETKGLKKSGKALARRFVPNRAYRRLSKVKRRVQIVSGKREPELVSVVIPTYRDNPYIYEAVESVLDQKGQKDFRLEILICANGCDVEYADKLTEKYRGNTTISVLFTPEKGAAAGRNIGIEVANGSYITFLDDDDFFTDRYVAELFKEMRRDVDIVCGRLIDYDEDSGKISKDTYINEHLKRARHVVSNDYVLHGTPFSGVCAKLYRTKFLRKCVPFEEGIGNTEDVTFWVDNAQLLKRDFVLCRARSRQAYVRRKTETSRSRPSPEASYQFYITDRIALIEQWSKRIFERIPIKAKKFVLKKIDAQTNIMANFFEGLDAEDKRRARQQIFACTSQFMNKSRFGEVVGVAFCHNFSPYVDASAYAATKRLSQISELFGHVVCWQVFAARMRSRKRDRIFDQFFARYQYDAISRVGKKTGFSERSQEEWGLATFEEANEVDADVIYSRSLWAGSHVAALKYKQHHPNAIWYAEFSDPLYMGADDMPRPISREYEADEAELNHFYRDLEVAVMRAADYVVYTNENQAQYMVASNPCIEDTELMAIQDKALVLAHTALPKEYAAIRPSSYSLDENRINVGYFGTFYANRNSESILRLLENPLVDLHMFCPGIADDDEFDFGEHVHMNKPVSHLTFLNLASRMDYLFISDVDFPGEVNPFVPSKLADYLSTDTRIIAEVKPGSVMSQNSSEKLIKISDVDGAFANSLEKHSVKERAGS